MKVKQYLKENGMELDHIDEVKQWGTVNIVFINSQDGYFDEVQFDVEIDCNLNKCKELEILFKEFCEENECDYDSVENIVLIRTADSYEELMQLEAEEEGYSFIS